MLRIQRRDAEDTEISAEKTKESRPYVFSAFPPRSPRLSVEENLFTLECDSHQEFGLILFAVYEAVGVYEVSCAPAGKANFGGDVDQ